MTIVLYSKEKYIIKTFNKVEIENLNNIVSYNDIYNLKIKNEKIFFFHHLDLNDDVNDFTKELKNDFDDISFIALRNRTNNVEGCNLLKKGYDAYMHALSNEHIIKDVIKTIKAGNKWIYPELMQFLIQSVPLINQKENEVLKKLTNKELEIVELVSQGLNNTQIADTLSIAEVTVKKHVSSLLKKFGVKDRLALALEFKNYIT